MSKIYAVIFSFVAVSILLSSHYYIWARLVRDTNLPQPVRLLANLTIITLGVTIPVGFILPHIGLGFTKPLIWASYVWLGITFLLVVFLIDFEFIHLLLKLIKSIAYLFNNKTVLSSVEKLQSKIVPRVVAIISLSLTFGLCFIGMNNALKIPKIEHQQIKISRLPISLSGMRIVQISDLHIGNLVSRSWLEQVVVEVNSLSPDVIVITGDFVDGSVSALQNEIAPLAKLKSRLGVYAVTGNHEYYSGVDTWLEHLSKLGVKMLRNERVTLTMNGAEIELAGIDDAEAARFGDEHGPDLDQALLGYDHKNPIILLAHQPKVISQAAAAGVDLVLSGHTHGGQIWPWSYIVALSQPVLAGWQMQDKTQIYVSRGTGFWGPPIRINAPSEITEIELIRID
ncbi:MAG: metallophosphoesterase [Deltaproteobacteria bacterium]|nr:metallophosphoesterase [Deltaproteobacteria bacterium]